MLINGISGKSLTNGNNDASGENRITFVPAFDVSYAFHFFSSANVEWRE